MSSFDFIRNS